MYQSFTLVGQDEREYLLQLDGHEGSWIFGDPPLDWGVRVEHCQDDPIFDPEVAAKTWDETNLGLIEPTATVNGPGYVFEPGERYRVELIAPMDGGWPRELLAEFVPYEEEPPAPTTCEPPIPAAACDPREGAGTCPRGQSCFVSSCTSLCVEGSGDALEGESCTQAGEVGECAPEFICVPAQLYPACDAGACCTRYCSTDVPSCPPELECFPFFTDEDAAESLETLGACIDS